MSSIKTILVALSALHMAGATTLHVNQGCIIANGQGLCSGSTQDIQGGLTVEACIVKQNDGTYAYCEWDGTVPTNWADVFFGADNCVYSAGSSPVGLGCSYTIEQTKVANVYG